MNAMPPLKPLVWVGSTHKILLSMPAEVQDHIGYALHLAQAGDKHDDAKPLSGFGGAGVVEIITDHRGDTFRSVYTVRFADAIYVLHVFQKKSKHGIKTPKNELDLIERRLREAERISKGEVS
jgi:phage-related protein